MARAELLELADLESAAVADLTLANITFEAGEEVLVPLKRLSGEQTRFDFRPALTCTVQGLSEQGVPVITAPWLTSRTERS